MRFRGKCMNRAKEATRIGGPQMKPAPLTRCATGKQTAVGRKSCDACIEAMQKKRHVRVERSRHSKGIIDLNQFRQVWRNAIGIF